MKNQNGQKHCHFDFRLIDESNKSRSWWSWNTSSGDDGTSFHNLLRGAVKKRIFYGQADRKGEGGGKA